MKFNLELIKFGIVTPLLHKYSPLFKIICLKKGVKSSQNTALILKKPKNHIKNINNKLNIIKKKLILILNLNFFIVNCHIWNILLFIKPGVLLYLLFYK